MRIQKIILKIAHIDGLVQKERNEMKKKKNMAEVV